MTETAKSLIASYLVLFGCTVVIVVALDSIVAQLKDIAKTIREKNAKKE